MGFGPDGLGPPGLLRQLEARIGPQAPVQLQNLMDQGLSPRDAFAQLSQATGFSPGPGQGPATGYPQGPGFDAGPPGRLEPSAVGQIFDSLPPDVQQAIVRGADQLPQPVRDALDQLGITQAQVQPQGRGDGPQQTQAAGALPEPAGGQRAGGADAVAGSPREAALNFARAEALAAATPPAAARADAVPLAANAAAVRDGAPQGAATQLPAGMAAERAAQQAAPALPGGRGTEGFVGTARDPGTVVAMPDRMAQLQPAPQQAPNAQTAQVRPDAVPMQAAMAGLAGLAGATVLANPQPAQMPGHVGLNAPAPPGTDAAAAQARELQLAPAGHTLAGFLRRDLRRGAAPDHRPEHWALALLAGNRKRRAHEAEEQMTSFQWLFWILTIVAYGSIGIALVVMALGGERLTNSYGAPSTAGYALVVGAAAAAASWLVGKRLAGKAE